MGEVWSLFSLAVVFTALRIYARVKVVGIKGLQAEDYLASVAMVSSTSRFSILTFFRLLLLFLVLGVSLE